MSAIVDGLKQARESLKAKEWRKSQAILAQMFPHSTNSKFISDLLRSALAAQKAGDTEQMEQLLWLAIEIYESGRDENAEVLTAIRLLYEQLAKSGRPTEAAQLCDRTFMLVLNGAEGLLRSMKSMSKQLNEKEGTAAQS